MSSPPSSITFTPLPKPDVQPLLEKFDALVNHHTDSYNRHLDEVLNKVENAESRMKQAQGTVGKVKQTVASATQHVGLAASAVASVNSPPLATVHQSSTAASKTRKKVIFVDMDGVCANLDQRLIEILRDRNLPGAEFVTDRKSFEYAGETDTKGGSDSSDSAALVTTEKRKEFEVVAKHIMSQPGFYADLAPIEGCVKALMEMEQDGWIVFFCSSPLKQYKYCVTEKYEWVERWFGKSWVSKIIIAKDKTVVGMNMVTGNSDDLVVLLDDKPHQTGANPCPSWTHVRFDQSYNRHLTDVHRLLKWSDWRQLNQLTNKPTKSVSTVVENSKQSHTSVDDKSIDSAKPQLNTAEVALLNEILDQMQSKKWTRHGTEVYDQDGVLFQNSYNKAKWPLLIHRDLGIWMYPKTVSIARVVDVLQSTSDPRCPQQAPRFPVPVVPPPFVMWQPRRTVSKTECFHCKMDVSVFAAANDGKIVWAENSLTGELAHVVKVPAYRYLNRSEDEPTRTRYLCCTLCYKLCPPSHVEYLLKTADFEEYTGK